MKDYILYRKITRIILQLADELQLSTKRAMLLFYSTKVGQQLHDPKYGYQIMSDTYIANDIKSELQELHGRSTVSAIGKCSGWGIPSLNILVVYFCNAVSIVFISFSNSSGV